MNPGLFPGFTLPYSSDPYPVGTIIQSIGDLEAQSGGMWLRCDGREIARSLYPELSKVLTTPVISAVTNRTLNSAPPNTTWTPIAGGTTCFVAAGAAGTSGMQYSTDGATWSAAWSAGWPASTACGDVIKAGSRFVMVPYAGASQPYVVNESGYGGGAWTVTTGATTASTTGPVLAYSPSLAMTAFVPGPAGTAVYTLADGATAWTSRTKTSGTSYGVVWSGSRFIILVTSGAFNNYIVTSTDGVTWTDTYIPVVTGYGTYIASDGAGTVVIAGGPRGFAVSKDGGLTWRFVVLPPETMYFVTNPSGSMYADTGGQWNVRWVGSRFIAMYYNGTKSAMLISADGMNWFVDSAQWKAGPAISMLAVAEKGTTLAVVKANSTSALSATWDYSKMRLPMTYIPVATAGSAVIGSTQRQEYIKARMA